jgi:catechol 2,3-dioxygenase-like lactoylglutathione lyase family enzyme
MNDLAFGATKAKQRAGHLVTRGVHHLVFTTDDMKMTIDFYGEVLGMPLVHAMKVPPGLGTGKANRGNPPFENIRHYFFDMGNDSLLAFFEIPKGAKPKSDRDAIGGMQHCSFVVPSKADFDALIERLKARGIQVVGPSKMASGPGYSIYFYDPNGVRLEASCDHTHEQPGVIRDATQPKGAILDELRTLNDDPQWLASVTAHLSA